MLQQGSVPAIGSAGEVYVAWQFGPTFSASGTSTNAEILAAIVGEPLDECSPELVVHSVRRLGRDDLTDIEERELIEAGGVVLEVVFELGRERWL